MFVQKIKVSRRAKVRVCMEEIKQHRRKGKEEKRRKRTRLKGWERFGKGLSELKMKTNYDIF